MSGRLVTVVREEQHDNRTTTENSMPAYKNAYSACLDLFFHGAAYRNKSVKDIENLFSRAYKEDAEVAIKILAYFRDIREGAGERRFFTTCLLWLVNNDKSDKDYLINIDQIPVLGRWDDLLPLIETSYKDDVLELISHGLTKQKDGLCAKWMPRKGKYARIIREKMGIYPKAYRKLLVENTKVVETQMCDKQWAEINYSHVPSVANVKYNKAFLRNDEVRRREFLEAAKKGSVKINSSVAYPHTIISMILTRSTTTSLKEGELLGRILKKNDTAIAMWKQLPDLMAKAPNKRYLFCSDTSGSMSGDPLLISLGMGIYFSERLKGPFQNAFITFSQVPTLQYTEGDIYERLSQIKALHPKNTNLEAIFTLVLNTALKNKISEDEMPTEIVIVSDMQFDQATGYPKDDAFKLIRKMYADSGYDMPNIVFWNVNARETNSPLETNSKGVALISGASQNAIKAVLSGVTTPVDVMLNTVNVDRYNKFLASKSL